MNEQDKAKRNEERDRSELIKATRKKWRSAQRKLNDEPLNRRSPENSLRRAAQDSERQENARVSRWMRLADVMFGQGGDDDPTPSAA